MTYNGWTNYETWVTALWIDNEEWSYRDNRYLAEEYGLEGLDNGSLAEAIKNWVDEIMIPEIPASLATDLIGAALSEVNWQEIAESHREDLEEDFEDDLEDDQDFEPERDESHD